MSDWKDLKLSPNIDVANFTKQQLHFLISESLDSKKGIWIAEVDHSVTYKLFNCLQEMCEDLWCEWPGDDVDGFIEEYKLDNNVPFILAEHARQYYVMANTELAAEFLRVSREVISNNPNEEEY